MSIPVVSSLSLSFSQSEHTRPDPDLSLYSSRDSLSNSYIVNWVFTCAIASSSVPNRYLIDNLRMDDQLVFADLTPLSSVPNLTSYPNYNLGDPSNMLGENLIIFFQWKFEQKFNVVSQFQRILRMVGTTDRMCWLQEYLLFSRPSHPPSPLPFPIHPMVSSIQWTLSPHRLLRRSATFFI